MKKYYLAYGSNLNVQQMKHRCPDAKPIGTAWIHGYQLLFNRFMKSKDITKWLRVFRITTDLPHT